MPSRIRGLKKTDRLSMRQKAIVRKLRSARLPVKVYKRGRKVSVHNLFLDIRRKARVPKFRPVLVSKYPQAFDTKAQRAVKSRAKKPKGSRKASPQRRRSLLLP